jgi:hypothetical protein
MDHGQTVRNVLIASFNLRQEQYSNERANRFLTGLRDGIAGTTGVAGASLTVNDPFVSGCGMRAWTVGIDGQSSEPFEIACDLVGGDFFKTMRVALLRGREFTVDDVRRGARVAVVDERFARTRFGTGDAVGRRIRTGTRPEDVREVVGVVATTTELALDRRVRPKVYMPVDGFTDAMLLVAHDGRTEALVTALRAHVAKADPNLTVSIKPIEQNVWFALAPPDRRPRRRRAFGAIGLVLACAASTASSRSRSGTGSVGLGIRIALGAEHASAADDSARTPAGRRERLSACWRGRSRSAHSRAALRRQSDRSDHVRC